MVEGSLALRLWGLDYLINTADFIVGMTRLDLTSANIVLAIAHANTSYLDGDLNFEDIGGLEAVPSDLGRLPISGYALSRLLGLPLETTRRRLEQLLVAGWCRRVHDGFLTPAAVWLSPTALGAVAMNSTRTAEQLARAPSSHRFGVTGFAGVGHPRVVNRASTEFFVDALQTLSRGLGLSRRALLILSALQIFSLSRRGSAFEANQLKAFTTRKILSLRRRVSNFEVSRRLHLPYESVRRTIAALREEGWIERVPDGRQLTSLALTDDGGLAETWAAFDVQIVRLMEQMSPTRISPSLQSDQNGEEREWTTPV